MRREGRLTAEQATALDFRLLCASSQAAQAATPTGQASRRLAPPDPGPEGLDDLIRRIRREGGAGADPAGRFHVPSVLRKPL